MNTSKVELGKYREQQTALCELYRKGYSRMAVAQMIGVTPNTVRAWDRGVKIACGRRRARLLSIVIKSERELKIVDPNLSIKRGRISNKEHERRVVAMGEAGLWPLRVCARKLKVIVEAAKAANITTDEIIEWLGVGRRTFYDYLDEDNTRLMSDEAIERLKDFASVVGIGAVLETSKLKSQTLEIRFRQASIILFEKYCVIGFAARDIVKENALRKLAEVTGYNERTLRRYLPLRIDNRRITRSIVEAFEDAARNFGSVVQDSF